MVKTAIKQATQNPLILTVINKDKKKFETIIQGKKITASFSTNPDENILKLVKTILIDSHTNHMKIEKRLEK